MLEDLKKEVYEANIELVNQGLVKYTWGNVSGLDKTRQYLVIKPSGVDYNILTYKDMIVVDLNNERVEGELKPSSDTPTHIEIYKAFSDVWGVAHTHSVYATAFAQAGKGINPYGTTHADYFYGKIPCTRQMLKEEVMEEYEKNTGKLIVETFEYLKYQDIPACLIKSHGPFTWGSDAKNAVFNSVVLEEVAKIAYLTETLNSEVSPISKYLTDKHFKRKHGKDAYYGQ